MPTYREGVFIHNFNEDQFGKELVEEKRNNPVTFHTPVSVSHSAFRDPADYGNREPAKPSDKVAGLTAELLFGHAGDMTTTKDFRNKDFLTASMHFHKRPEEGKQVQYETAPSCTRTFKSSLITKRASDLRYAKPIGVGLEDNPNVDVPRYARANEGFTSRFDLVAPV